MEEVLASVDNLTFDVEFALEQQIGSLPLPFPGMDKSGAAVCLFHLRGTCERGSSCPYRHIKADRTIVCKHWLRGLCKKGDQCEFLHEYDMSKMPECYFYTRFKACSNKECPFLHIDPESKIRDCPWYDRGFCRHGPNCRHRHTRRIICLNYLTGFCPIGPDCKQVHPRFDLPILDAAERLKKGAVVCHFCGEAGHKIYTCPKMTPAERDEHLANNPHLGYGAGYPFNHPGSSAPHGQNHIKDGLAFSERPERRVPVHERLQDQNQQQKPPFYHRQQNANHNQGYTQQPHYQHSGGFQDQAGEQKDGARGGVGGGGRQVRRPLDQVTCYKCGLLGHYANKCPKGHLAFLSPALQQNQPRQASGP